MHKIVMMTFAGTFGGLACGYNSGVVAPVMLYMDEVYPGIKAISKAEFVSYAILTGTLGAMMADLLGDKFGRRWSIIFSDCFLIGGAAVLSISLGSVMLSFGRLILGYGLGL